MDVICVRHQQGLSFRVMKPTQFIWFPFSSKLNDCVHNPIIMILSVARPLPPQCDGISHGSSRNKAQTHWVSAKRPAMHSGPIRRINEQQALWRTSAPPLPPPHILLIVFTGPNVSSSDLHRFTNRSGVCCKSWFKTVRDQVIVWRERRALNASWYESVQLKKNDHRF